MMLNILPDEIIPLFVLSAIAIPFLVVFLLDRKQWWALIPAYVLFVVAVMVTLIESGFLADLLIPAYILFAIAAAFFVVFAFNPKQWWALIPTGILVVVGLSFLIVEAAAGVIVPVLLFIVGIWIIARQFLPRKPERVEESAANASEGGEHPTD